MPTSVGEVATLFGHILITAFATVALTAAGTVTALTVLFNISGKEEITAFRWILAALSVYLHLSGLHHLATSDKCQEGEYGDCVGMMAGFAMLGIVGVATGMMLTVALGHVVYTFAGQTMAKVDKLRRSASRRSDSDVARFGVILVYLAAASVLFSAVILSACSWEISLGVRDSSLLAVEV